MRRNRTTTRLSATRIVASLFGMLAAVGGMTHGVGEVLQGNVAAEGFFINSWTQGPIATHMGGEPGITIVPNLLATGLLTILTALSILVWATLFVQRKHGGWILMALSAVLLLVGGGIGPPLIGMLAGIAGTRINPPLSRRGGRLPVAARRFLAGLWPWLFAIAVASGSFLVIGSLLLVYLFGLDNADLFLNMFYITVLFLLLTVLTAPLFDCQKRDQDAAILS